MKGRIYKLKPSESHSDNKEENHFQGYPNYPDNEDIYENIQEKEDINPENTSKIKVPNSDIAFRRKDLDVENSENDLDIPDAELDDLQKDIGSKYEENNYYNLGGEEHIDLEEDKGK